jgi:cytochrome c-type biogenesis protein CcmH
MMFWILAILLALIAMGFVCLPLFRNSVSSSTELDSEQTLYQARLSEIEKDLELGRLDKISAEAAKNEEARRLIKSSESGHDNTPSTSNKVLVWLAAISLPMISIPFYYSVGSPGYSPAVNQVEQTTSSQPSMQDLLKVAETQLKKNPDDTKGWKAVAPVYVRLGRFDDAINAYQNVLRVEGRKPEFLLKLADVYIEKDQGQIGQLAMELIQETLSIDNENPIARFYTGIIALQKDEKDETMRIWQGMLDGAKGDEEWLPVVEGRISELRMLMKTPQLPALDEETISSAEEMEPDERIAMIGQMVSNLAQKLENNPDNKQGWERLIRSYIVLGRTDDAKNALTRAAAHFVDDKQFIIALENMIKTEDNSSNGGSQ